MNKEEILKKLLDFEAHTFVTSSAGTGKTTLLVSKIVLYIFHEFVISKKKPFEIVKKILAVTFTEKAAFEMAERLRDYFFKLTSTKNITDDSPLSLVLSGIKNGLGINDDGKIEEMAAELLNYLDFMEISTFHSFCAKILREYGYLIGVNPGFEIDSTQEKIDEELEKIFYEKFKEHVKNIDKQNISNNSFIFDIKNFKFLVKKLVMSPIPDSVLLKTQSIGQVYETALEEFVQSCEHSGKKIINYSIYKKNREKIIKKFKDVLKVWSQNIKKIDDIFKQTILQFKSYLLTLKTGKKGVINAPFDGKMVEILNFIKSIHLFVSIKPLLIDKFTIETRQQLYKLGLLNFNHLISLTYELLSKKPSVVSELKKRFNLILIDETQDTNPLQYEIVKLIAKPANHEKKGDIPKLFVIGDAKQSIYLFRGADIEAYLDFRKDFPLALELNLTTNYRSHYKIINFVNSYFEKRMIASDHKNFQSPYERFEPFRQQETDADEDGVIFFVKEVDGKANSEEIREKEAEIISEIIKKLTSENKGTNDIAILFKSMNSIDIYVKKLEDAGISYVITGSKHFFRKIEIIDALNLCLLLLYPMEFANFIHVLRSPLVLISDDSIYRNITEFKKFFSFIKKGEKLPDTKHFNFSFSHKERERFNYFVDDLNFLLGVKQKTPLVDFLTLIENRFFLKEIYLGATQSVQIHANIEKFFDELRKTASSGTSLSSALVSFFSAEKFFQEEEENIIADEKSDAVKIMTIHKSKGLEFDVVILADITRRTGSQNKKFDLLYFRDEFGFYQRGGLISPFYKKLSREHRIRENFELIRLLYVAMTRARKKLIFPTVIPSSGAVSTRSVKPFLEEILKLYDINFDNVRKTQDSEIKFKNFKIVYDLSINDNTTDESPNGGHFIPEFSKYDEAFFNRLLMYEKKYSEEPIFKSPTSIQDQTITKQFFDFTEEASGLSSEASDYGKLFGTVCHEILEQLNFSNVDSSFESVKRKVIKKNKVSDPHLVDEVTKIFKEKILNSAIFTEYVLNTEEHFREIPLLLKTDGEKFSARIDFIGKKDGKYFILDYKTDSLLPDQKKAQSHYGQQARIYKTGLKKALNLSYEPDFFLYFLRHDKLIKI